MLPEERRLKEIKELLEDFKTIRNSDCIYEISSQDCELLLDYIFDLKADRIELTCKNLKLKDIIKKAIEYIENNDDEWFSTVELIDILRGEDNE